MKTILLSIVFLGVAFASQEWINDFEEGKKIAKQKNLPLLVMYSTQGCPECQYMKKKVFKDKQIETKMSNDFVLVALDIHKDKLPFDFFGIPTFYFTKPDGTLIDKKVGGSREKDFLAKLNEIKK